MRKFKEVVERTEEVRKMLGLNKSQFSKKIGMKPQTYNNYIGQQGSKPNIELISGIVEKFNVNPLWLLRGEGAVTRPEGNEPQGAATSSLTPLQVRIAEIEESVRDLQERMPAPMPTAEATIRDAVNIVKRWFAADPDTTLRELRALLTDLGKSAGGSLRSKKTPRA